MPVVFIEKFHKLDISSPAQLDCLLEQRPTEVAGDHGVAVGVNHDDGDRHQRQLLVRDKVHLGPGSEQPGEDRAGQDGGPGFGPGVTVELVRQVVEGRLQDEGTESALGAGDDMRSHSGAETVAPHQDRAGHLPVLPEPGQDGLHVGHHGVHGDQA